MAPPRASTRGDLETRPKFPFQFLTKSSGEVEREMYCILDPFPPWRGARRIGSRKAARIRAPAPFWPRSEGRLGRKRAFCINSVPAWVAQAGLGRETCQAGYLRDIVFYDGLRDHVHSHTCFTTCCAIPVAEGVVRRDRQASRGKPSFAFGGHGTS